LRPRSSVSRWSEVALQHILLGEPSPRRSLEPDILSRSKLSSNPPSTVDRPRHDRSTPRTTMAKRFSAVGLSLRDGLKNPRTFS
jgi:hypothetical protein